MRELADEYDLICSAIFRDGNEIVYRGQASSVSHLGHSPARGTRRPLWPLQQAATFFVSAPKEEAEAWLSRLPDPPEPAERDLFYSCLKFVSEHGYQFAVRERLTSHERDEHSSDLLADRSPLMVVDSIEPKNSYRTVAIMSPVFDETGRVAFALSLSGFDRPQSGIDVAAVGARLADRCRRISVFARSD
jgi:DNA-binding IclR family transcriptional regulator